jgi:hypothetical protein
VRCGLRYLREQMDARIKAVLLRAVNRLFSSRSSYICIIFLVSLVHFHLIMILSAAAPPHPAAFHCWHMVREHILHKPGSFLYFALIHCHSGQALGGYFHVEDNTSEVVCA